MAFLVEYGPNIIGKKELIMESFWVILEQNQNMFPPVLMYDCTSGELKTLFWFQDSRSNTYINILL